MTKRLSDLATLTMCVCALLLTAVAVRREFANTPARGKMESPLGHFRPARENASVLAEDGHAVGGVGSRITIVEFADFQCPYCARAESLLASISHRYEGQVRLAFRHYPIVAAHPYALEAALASECAAAQGSFENFRRELFAHQDSIGLTPWRQFASRAHLPRPHEFANCLLDQRYRSQVERDVAAGHALGIRATPTFVIGGSLVEGLPDPVELDSVLASLATSPRAGHSQGGR